MGDGKTLTLHGCGFGVEGELRGLQYYGPWLGIAAGAFRDGYFEQVLIYWSMQPLVAGPTASIYHGAGCRTANYNGVLAGIFRSTAGGSCLAVEPDSCILCQDVWGNATGAGTYAYHIINGKLLYANINDINGLTAAVDVRLGGGNLAYGALPAISANGSAAVQRIW